MESREANGSTGQLSSGGSIGGGYASSTGMHHSHSTPAGVDGVGGGGAGGGGGSRTPPATPKKGGKMLAIRVQMLDDTITIFQVQAKALGQVLFDQVCKQLHLLEADYFGLEYTDLSQTRYWLDLQKPMSRQLGLSLVDPLLQFCVKFYTPDPGQLEEEYTRYLYCLQVKRDLAVGLMHCNDNTAALMASYIVQAECGDYVAEDYPDHTYLSSYKFVPHQDPEMERRIMENHKKHAGQSPAEADLNLLETARRCELYGIKLHPAKDHENVPLNLAVAHMGIVVYQQITKINTFSWAKIRKLSFKRKKFLIKLHPEGYGYYKDTVEFFFEGRDECKNFWKKCVENHGFFRCSTVQYVSRHKTRVLSRGSSFRYSGKTQKQMVEFVRDNYVKRQTFQRSASFRHSSAHLNANNKNTSSVGNSISAHPLLPLADSNLSVEVSKLSASLGAMGPSAAVAAAVSASTTAVGAYPSCAATARTSPTTRSAYHHRGTPTCWSSAPDTRPTTLPARTTSSPSPPRTTRSASPAATSAATSPLHTVAVAAATAAAVAEEQEDLVMAADHLRRSPPPAPVRAAVHRADTTAGTLLAPTTHHIIIRTPCNRPPSQTQSQNDLDHATPPHPQFHTDFSGEPDDACASEAASLPPHVKRHVWRRSASCRDLYDFSFEDSGQAKRRIKPDHAHHYHSCANQAAATATAAAAAAHELTSHLDERKLESPVTRYGDDHRAIYASSQNTSLEIHQDIMSPEQKVYSSSYPGTTAYAQESMEDPGNYELRDSQDDVSHDSYDLIERSDDEYSTSGESKYAKIKGVSTTRSCSLDSGRYIPSDSDSELDKHIKCKSSEDIHPDIFAMEDPRDFPREIVPRKSDGSFYKNLKPSSRTSSQESKSDYYDTRVVSKKRRSISSRTSSQESKSDYETKKHHRRKSNAKFDSRQSSAESKSEYYDAPAEPKSPKLDYDRHIHFERNYGTQKQRPQDNSEINRNYSHFKETSHVHSISLQNVETGQNIRANRMAANLEQNTVPRTQKRTQSDSADRRSVTHIWPESIVGVPTQIQDWAVKQQSTKSTESESNIFSFDEERIKSLEESDDYAMIPTLPPRNGSTEREPEKKNYRDVFVEIEPRKLDLKDPMMHQPIERTKSDPNNLAWQRLNSNSRRMLLKHQKSIDLTPAESSDEDYLYKQIPSAPPIMKYRGNSTHFEMPSAEFGHFDILKREVEGEKTRFEVPKKQFEILGAKTQSDFINLPPKTEADISYVLHKRHVMNGTSKEEAPDVCRVPDVVDFENNKKKPKSPSAIDPVPVPTSTSFLFTQNIDLSKVDPVTLEVDKTAKPIQHLSSPKRDITRIDPAILETLNSKLSQIESDSPTSSRTESLKPAQKIKALQQIEEVPSRKPEIVGVKPKINVEKPGGDKIKTDIKPKRIIKSRMQPGKKFKGNKTKVRITSFSSDDESLDSDDVFGSAEATPTKLEFSPPQMRKEMESILKYESERKYLQYTMSSTEVEGSPPTTRRTDTLYSRNEEQPELRRISERSLSIPSSEDDFNIKNSELPAVFEPDEADEHDEVTLTLETLEEVEKEADKSIEDTVTVEMTEQVTIQEFLKEEDLKEIDEEKEKEKAQLLEDIEQDIKDLKVPPKTKITEICSPNSRRKGQSPMLFAHARLNLSEGSAFTLLQKQQALESPVAGRRAKSLDTPVISVNRLPPLNSFSSKDDTVEEEEDLPHRELPIKEMEELPKLPSPQAVSKPLPAVVKVEDKKPVTKTVKKPLPVKQKSIEKDQIVPDVSKAKKPTRATTTKVKPTVKTKTTVTPPKPSTTKTVATAPKVVKKVTTTVTTTVTSNTTTTTAKARTPVVGTKPPVIGTKPTVVGTKPAVVGTKPPIAKVKPTPPKSLSLDKGNDLEKKPEPVITQKSLPSQNSLQLPGHEIKRTKSQELESSKRPATKEKARSLEKLEFKRTSSKERTKSQDEEVDSAKRQEYQQMLYETAMKQTKTVKSPVKDILPVFPQVEEMVRERGGKLEISINTIETAGVNLEEAIIITKSPKKLDKKLLDQKLTKSLELTLGDEEDQETNGRTIERLGKSLDLEPRIPTPEVFDFKKETIESMNKIVSPDSPQGDDIVGDVADIQSSETLDTDTEETLQDTEATQLVLEGTSLDVWISVDGTHEIAPPHGYESIELHEEFQKPEMLKDITILEKSTNFFESPSVSKPPDLVRMQETFKSSSSSQSNEKLSLGNSLDMKYADESGESSHRSDTAFVQELKKASQTVEKLLMKKIAKRRQLEEARAKEIPEESEPELHELQQTLVRITSEDESLTSVSDIKMEYQDMNFLGVGTEQRDALLKLSIERSKSEDTGSWMTVECDEYVGQESFEYDNADNLSKQATPTKDIAKSPTTEEPKNLLSAPTQNKKLEILKRSSDQSRSSDTGSWTSGEKDLSPGKTGDESSVSCSIGFAIGLSQTIEKFSTKEQLDKSSPEMDQPRSPRSPRICVLGRAFTIDEDFGVKSESSSEGEAAAGGPTDLGPIQEEDGKAKKPYPFEEKWSNDSELTQRLHQKITKKLSSSEKNSLSSIDDSLMDKRRGGSLEKPSLNSVDRLSAESRNSVDTESSSGSFGLANRGGLHEMSCTWKRFPLGESGSASSSIEEVDPDFYAQEYFLSRENSGDISALDVYRLDPDATPTRETIDDDLDKYNYPLGGFPPDLIGTTYNTPNFLSRTLSRISERSSNSEKTDEDSIKASLSEASHEESLHQGSLSSGSPSNAQGSDKKVKTALVKQPSKESKESEKFDLPNMTNMLQRQISDDRRTSAEMAELSIDDIEIITSERGLRLKRQDSDDTIIDEDMNEKHSSSSQESDEWPLPEIPMQRPLMAMHETPSSDNSTQQTTQFYQPPVVLPDIPRVFGLRGSIVSQTSEQWPSPPSSVADNDPPGQSTAVKVETHYITPPEEACKVIVESTTQSYENDSNSLSDKTLEYEVEEEEKTHTYENVATDQISESISESLSVGPSGVKIVLEPKSGSNSNSDEFNVSSNIQDDVFTTEHHACESRNELRPPTVMRRSTTSDDSSHSGNNNNNHRKKSKSHSSYSDEEEATSSLGTTLEDGTVRYAYKPTKCTHSSHSEDTSIALSLSEWSNSTTTVKFQNLSSNSGKSSGLKSDDNSLTDIAHSISEWSSSNSNTLKAQSMQFQKLSSSTGDSSTLTDMMGKDWSTGSDKMMGQPKFYSTDRSSLSRLGSSIEEPELETTSPRTIASDELARFGHVISVAPVTLSDEKSSSSQEQRTVHTQRYDKDKQKYAKHQYQPSANLRTSSVDRPVKVPLKLAKCSPYYSSSLSSESTPMTVTHPLPICKTATIPLTRTHKKPVAKGTLFQARSPPSENDSTSSMESAKCKSEPRRGYRRRRHTPQKRHRVDKECGHLSKDDYFYVDPETTEYNEYIRNRSFEELACGYQYEHIQAENLEEGYYPDGDSQSGSDIFRMERDEPEPLEPETFDVSSIPPPLIEDDFEQHNDEDDEGADI